MQLTCETEYSEIYKHKVSEIPNMYSEYFKFNMLFQ